MNANELADELNGRLDHKAANMILKQQAEIEALKQIIDANNLSQNIGQFVKPVKELTDKEIKSVWKKMVCPVHITKSELDFAKAILRKAQEK